MIGEWDWIWYGVEENLAEFEICNNPAKCSEKKYYNCGGKAIKMYLEQNDDCKFSYKIIYDKFKIKFNYDKMKKQQEDRDILDKRNVELYLLKNVKFKVGNFEHYQLPVIINITKITKKYVYFTSNFKENPEKPKVLKKLGNNDNEFLNMFNGMEVYANHLVKI